MWLKNADNTVKPNLMATKMLATSKYSVVLGAKLTDRGEREVWIEGSVRFVIESEVPHFCFST